MMSTQKHFRCQGDVSMKKASKADYLDVHFVQSGALDKNENELMQNPSPCTDSPYLSEHYWEHMSIWQSSVQHCTTCCVQVQVGRSSLCYQVDSKAPKGQVLGRLSGNAP